MQANCAFRNNAMMTLMVAIMSVEIHIWMIYRFLFYKTEILLRKCAFYLNKPYLYNLLLLLVCYHLKNYDYIVYNYIKYILSLKLIEYRLYQLHLIHVKNYFCSLSFKETKLISK